MIGTVPDRASLGRRSFLRRGARAGLLAGLAAGATTLPDAAGASEQPPAGPREALRLLMEGNQRWAAGRPRHPQQSVARRHEVAGHQDPFATVVSCIDSRVPPEIVFDRGLGDMFDIRTGAQTLDQRVVLGSIEFGPVNYASSRLLFVLGHQSCGAVQAAITAIQTGERAPGHIQAVVNALRPAYQVAIKQPGDLLYNTIQAQTRLTVQRLQRDPVLAELIAKENLAVVGGYYHLYSGVVSIIT